CLHGAHGPCSARSIVRAGAADRRTFSVGRGRSGGLPGEQPAGVGVDSFAGARPRERHHLRGCRRGRRSGPAADLIHPRALRLTLSYSTFGYVAYIFFTWFFIYLNRVRGLNLKSSSYYGMLPFIAMAIGSPLGGIISDRLTKRYGKRGGRSVMAIAGLALSGI